jgi:hypothetical protein
VLAQLVGEHAEVVDQVGEFPAALGDQGVEAVEVAVKGAKASQEVAQVPALPPEACPAPTRSRRRYAWVSASRAERISSRLTSGAVFASGTPSGIAPADFVPGSSSKSMSLRPVAGRIRMVALR